MKHDDGGATTIERRAGGDARAKEPIERGKRAREVVSCESREAVFEGGRTTESGDYPFIANPGFRGFELESARSDRACV